MEKTKSKKYLVAHLVFATFLFGWVFHSFKTHPSAATEVVVISLVASCVFYQSMNFIHALGARKLTNEPKSQKTKKQG